MEKAKPGEIEKILAALIIKEHGSLVQMRVEPAGSKAETITLTLKPRLWGGYAGSAATLVLTSSFDRAVQVSFLQTEPPVALSGVPGVRASVQPGVVDLPSQKEQPQKERRLMLAVAFEGQRPQDGIVRGTYTFKFAPGSTQFYPQQGPLEVLLPSWWESYGKLAIAVAIGVLLILGVLAWMIRRAQVPEVQVVVTSHPNRLLGDTMRIRKGESFAIANGQLVGRVVPAPGLSCSTAATVHYLGRRKFEVVAQEASIVQTDGQTPRLTIGLEEPFDLKDSAGKVLRDIMLSTPGRAGGGLFAGQHDSDPF